MSGVFQNIDPPPPSLPSECEPPPPPPLVGGGGHTRWVERGVGGVNILEDARHSSVFYLCKYFVDYAYDSISQDSPFKVTLT